MKSDVDSAGKSDYSYNFNFGTPSTNFGVSTTTTNLNVSGANLASSSNINPIKSSVRNQIPTTNDGNYVFTTTDHSPKLQQGDSKTTSKSNNLNYVPAGNKPVNNYNIAPNVSYGIEAKPKTSQANNSIANNHSGSNGYQNDPKPLKTTTGASNIQGLKYAPTSNNYTSSENPAKNNVPHGYVPANNILSDYNKYSEQFSTKGPGKASGNLNTKKVESAKIGNEAKEYYPTSNYTGTDRSPNNQNYNFSNIIQKNPVPEATTTTVDPNKFSAANFTYVGNLVPPKKK